MGIEGAATATVAARFVELSIVLLWIYGWKAYNFTVGKNLLISPNCLEPMELQLYLELQEK